MWENNPAYALQVNSDFAGSVAMGQGQLWEIERMDGYWKLTIRRNLSELNWHGILTCMKNIHPNVQGIYDAIFEQFYEGCDWIVDYDGWYTSANGSFEIYVPNEVGKSYGEYWFK